MALQNDYFFFDSEVAKCNDLTPRSTRISASVCGENDAVSLEWRVS